MLFSVYDFYGRFVVPEIDDYLDAEKSLSLAYAALSELGACRTEADRAVRRACTAAIALDGLVDRLSNATGRKRPSIEAEVDRLAFWAKGQPPREGAVARVCALANAYKHEVLTYSKHPFKSFYEVAAVGLGYGLDGFGVGKMGGPEVLVPNESGEKRKFLGDVHVVDKAWKRLFASKGFGIDPDSLP
jgi:hypothetical protein